MTEPNHPAADNPPAPCIGIFWHVEGSLVADRCPLADAEAYGDFLTTRGHYEVWEMWRRRGERWLQEQGMPVSILMDEYEDHPRGRIVYDTTSELFIIYADRRLQTGQIIDAIKLLFALEDTDTQVKSDSHYR